MNTTPVGKIEFGPIVRKGFPDRIQSMQIGVDEILKRDKRIAELEAKVARADAILLEVYGAYNRIGDALKLKERKAGEG